MVSRSPILRRPFAPIALLLATLVASPSARAADPTAADRQTARALMDAGHAQRARGEIREALESFRAADAVMHVPSTGIEVARAFAQVGRLLDAYEAALAVRRSAVRADEPAPFADARRDADHLLDELDARIPTLRVSVHGADGSPVEVTLDGAPLPLSPDPASPILRKLDPGSHLLVAAAGPRRVESAVTVIEGERRDVVLDLPPAPPRPAPSMEPSAAPILPPAAAASAAPHADGSHTLLYTGVAVGGAGLVTGIVTGLVALSHRNTAQERCVEDRCPPAVHGDVDAARAFGNASTVAFVVAGVGAALVVVDIVRPRSRTPVSVGVTPGGLLLHGSF